MNTNEELKLLIKSKYPLIFFETTDETYASWQLETISKELDFDCYQWSLTNGLKKLDNDGSYYQTKDPGGMLRTVLEFIKPQEGVEIKPELFIFKDFNKYLDDVLVARLLKDFINLLKNTQNTLVILSAEYKLPKDIEADSAHLIGGFPNEEEIETIIQNTIRETEKTTQEVLLLVSPEELKKIIQALKGLSIQQIRNIINQCIIDDNLLNIKDLALIESYKKKVFDNEGLLEFFLPEDKNNIAGFNNLKHWIAERKQIICMNQTSSLPFPKGLLLMGVQGCGKSLAVKAIAQEFALPLYRLDLAKLFSKYIGETEQNLRKAFMIIDKLCPLCLWVDEIEKGFAASQGDIDGGVSMRILGTFLTWMQERTSKCFIAATANNIYSLPPEFLRKGRFDEIFFVDLPDAKNRYDLFQIHLKKRGFNPGDFDLKKLSAETNNFSGAEIEQAIISALYSASTNKEEITTQHILDHIYSTKPLAVLKEEEITALRAWAKERTIPA